VPCGRGLRIAGDWDVGNGFPWKTRSEISGGAGGVAETPVEHLMTSGAAQLVRLKVQVGLGEGSDDLDGLEVGIRGGRLITVAIGTGRGAAGHGMRSFR